MSFHLEHLYYLLSCLLFLSLFWMALPLVSSYPFEAIYQQTPLSTGLFFQTVINGADDKRLLAIFSMILQSRKYNSMIRRLSWQEKGIDISVLCLVFSLYFLQKKIYLYPKYITSNSFNNNIIKIACVAIYYFLPLFFLFSKTPFYSTHEWQNAKKWHIGREKNKLHRFYFTTRFSDS